MSVRWVASSSHTVTSVWKSYAALHAHFPQKALDVSLDSRERSKCFGLAKKLECPVFVKNLGLMVDALEELADLSLELQKADITLSSAKKLISKQVAVFVARKDSESEHYTSL